MLTGNLAYLFFDESGKWQDRDFICLCAYLSDDPHWEWFLREWSSTFERHHLNSLHMTTFYHTAKKKGWSDEKQNQVLGEFASVIRDSILMGFSVGLDARHYRSLPKSARGALGDPAAACLQRILRMIRKRLVSEGYDGRISITMDEEEGAVVNLYNSLVRLRKIDPLLGKYVGAVCFADDEYILPLQAADMLANLTSRWFSDIKNGKATREEMPKILGSLVTRPGTQYGLDYTSEMWAAEDLNRALNHFLGRKKR
ncbi:MAG: DUF3800 domain-containing protein [Acidobacteriia bacterium]|nr:DUF3800 domain-containing protein [Terriglobia bacterium]